MKTFFSEYQYFPDVRKACHGRVISQADLNALFTREAPPNLDVLRHLMVQSEEIMLMGGGVDYFMLTPTLSDLLKSMVRSYTEDVFDVFADFRRTAFVIHPISPEPAVLVGIFNYGTHVHVVMVSKVDGKKRAKVITNGFHGQIVPECEHERLAVGLALYARFFPGAVIDGLPDIAKNPAHYRGKKCASVGIAEGLINRSGPKPHIRQAHFRFLGSEKFVHKKGQYTLVKESFIRGKCKIVVEVE